MSLELDCHAFGVGVLQSAESGASWDVAQREVTQLPLTPEADSQLLASEAAAAQLVAECPDHSCGFSYIDLGDTQHPLLMLTPPTKCCIQGQSPLLSNKELCVHGADKCTTHVLYSLGI